MIQHIFSSLIFLFSFNCFLLKGNCQSFYKNQDLRFKHYQIKDGLPSNSVQTILQDSVGFLWFGTQIGLTRYDGHQFKLPLLQAEHFRGITHGSIRSLLQDDKGNIWIGTQQNGIFRYDPKSWLAEKIVLDNSDSVWSRVSKIIQNKHNEIIVKTFQKLYYIDSTLVAHELPTLDSKRNNVRIDDIIYFNDELIVLASGRLFHGHLTHSKKELRLHSFQSMVGNHNITSIKLVDGHVWVLGNGDGTSNITQIGQLKSDTIIWYKSVLSERNLWDIELDEKNFWVSSFGDGLIKMEREKLLYGSRSDEDYTTYLFTGKDDFPIGRNHVQTLMFDKSGSLWIGTWLQGLYEIHPSVNSIKHYSLPPNLPNGNHSVYSIYQNQDQEYWISTYMNGLILMKEDELFQNISQVPVGSYPMSSLDIFEDHLGIVWSLATNLTLHKFYSPFHSEKINFSSLPGYNNNEAVLPQFFLHGACIDEDGTFWIGSNGKGLFHYDPGTNELLGHFTSNPSETNSLGSNTVLQTHRSPDGQIWLSCNSAGLYKVVKQAKGNIAFKKCSPNINTIYAIKSDSLGNLWLGTLTDGLIKYNISTEEHEFFSVKDNLPHDCIHDVLIDQAGQWLWLVTPKGLVYYNPDTRQSYLYGDDLGIESEQRLMAKAHKFKDKVLVSNPTGFYAFNESITKSNTVPEVTFISITIENEEKVPESDSWLPSGLPYLNFIELNHNQNSFDIQYTCLNQRLASMISYEYKIESLHANWIDLGNENHIRINGISPGTYTLKVRAQSQSGEWGKESQLTIRIKSAWWASDIAWICYGLFLASILLFTSRYILRKKLLETETNRLKELDKAKSRFYANLTHEFRTPLTIIKAAASEIYSDPKKWINPGIRSIGKNADHLNHLVQQLLDLSKLEDKQMEIHYAQYDLVMVLTKICNRFSTYARRQGIYLEFQSKLQDLYMDFDLNKLTTIISNLVSNALKYSEREGYVSISLCIQNSEKFRRAKIEVQDQGIGIDTEHLPHIFKRFYRVDDSDTMNQPGTGIGLALTKELIELMDGDITVISTTKKGSSFIVTLPITQNFPKSKIDQSDFLNNVEPYFVDLPPNIKTYNYDHSKDSILIVEDHITLSNHLQKSLSHMYNVYTAYDGSTGWKIASEQVPDIIICDIMMPILDGITLSQKIKSDPITNHIPIIMLTAKADQETKNTGLKTGVDAFISKPFNKEELQIRILSLIRSRKLLQQKYQNKPHELMGNSNDPFIVALNDLISQNFHDENFGIVSMCEKLLVSRVQLHRKLKALSGFSASHYLRRYRIFKSLELLEGSSYNISEIGFRVGFKSSAYFTQVFTKVMGYPPTEHKLRINP